MAYPEAACIDAGLDVSVAPGTAALLRRLTASFSRAAPGAPRPVTGVRGMPVQGQATRHRLRPRHRTCSARQGAHHADRRMNWAHTSHAITVIDITGRIVDRWTLQHAEPGLATAPARLAGHACSTGPPVAIRTVTSAKTDPFCLPRHIESDAARGVQRARQGATPQRAITWAVR